MSDKAVKERVDHASQILRALHDARESVVALDSERVLAQEAMRVTDEMVSRFLRWPLPKSVNADLCATDPSYKFPRSGTNLLNADEARQMLEYVLGKSP